MDDLKPLLLQLLTKVDAIQADVSSLKAGQARLEDDVRQIKEVVGVVRMREIARLDGRIDELTQVVVLGQKSAAE